MVLRFPISPEGDHPRAVCASRRPHLPTYSPNMSGAYSLTDLQPFQIGMSAGRSDGAKLTETNIPFRVWTVI